MYIYIHILIKRHLAKRFIVGTYLTKKLLYISLEYIYAVTIVTFMKFGERRGRVLKRYSLYIYIFFKYTYRN